VGGALKAVCAWCEHDRRRASNGEGLTPPAERPTHGICPRHEQEMLASVPSRSFPGVEFLIVVERPATALYDQVQCAIGGLKGVAVIVDRRVGPRRREEDTAVDIRRERRHGDRRRRQPVASGPGYIVLQLGGDGAVLPRSPSQAAPADH
jgi:hypothetical protein